MDSQFKSNGLAALNALPVCKGQNATPPGGFTNFIQPTLSQNFNFVGEQSQFAPIQAAADFGRYAIRYTIKGQ